MLNAIEYLSLIFLLCFCASMTSADIIAGCDKHTGECLNVASCASGWGGSDCQIALPILKRNPTTSVTENSITISWEPWTSSIDYGTGPVTKYQVIYRTPPNSGFPFILLRKVNVDDLMRVDIDDLEPRTNYEIRIILHRQIDGENYTSIGSSKIVVTSGEDKIMDFTFYCATPRVDVDDNTMSTFIGGYSGSYHQTSDIQIGKIVTENEDFLGRAITWNYGSKAGTILGNETTFPAGTCVEVSTNRKFNALRVFIDSASGVNKLGVFYAKANKYLGMYRHISSEIVSIVLSKHASITSIRRTWTTGIGERVMMNMVGDNSTDKWWRHNGITLNEWNSLFIRIDVVRKQDAGIYECLPSENWENGNKGITNLIVRECPLRKWGPPDCLRNCPTCYNGGVCDDVTGSCVCTVGFRGINCEIACGSQLFGRKCTIYCAKSNEESCMGKMICPPSPQGCSCTDGYTGPDCIQECSLGMYGSDCQQKCQCDISHCDRKVGCSGTCYEGYTGPQCQELVHDRTCSNGHFGALCNYPCHCQHSSNCHRNGSCDNGCAAEWTGTDCSIALPYIWRRLNVTNIQATSIDVSHLWVFGKDFGTGPATAYILCYRSTTDWFCQKTLNIFSTIAGLIPNTTIEVKVQVFKKIDNDHIGGPVKTVTTIRTICLEPLDSPKIETLSTIKDTIVVKWKAVDFNPTRLQCDSLLHYAVGYQTEVNDAWETFQVHYDQTEATIRSLAYNMVYQVRVRAVNTAGITGPWSEMWKIKIPENKTGAKIAIYMRSLVVALLLTVVVLVKLRQMKREINGFKKDSEKFQINTISKPSQNDQDDSYTSLQKEERCLTESLIQRTV
ncbi:uncharacterized protein [Antedon mediterranea]|uniref:uncharacterized protein n=1 Tax=Antedon mediterranea TaxID=105859 RepID=UPI003AF4DB6A